MPSSKSVVNGDSENNKSISVSCDILEGLHESGYPSQPDGCIKDNPSNREFMKHYVYDVYERIAKHFSHTRYRPWPGVANFLKELSIGSIVLDVGCGNGKYASSNENIVWIGGAHAQRVQELNVVDCLNLTVRSRAVDACLCIAVIHHLPTESQRKKAISELIRCTKRGGFILIYVWSTEQRYGSVGARTFNSQDVFVPWKLQQHLDPLYDKSALEGNTENRGTKKATNLTTLYRYYHLFTLEEVQHLCSKVEGAEVVKIDFDNNNWKIVLKSI